MALIALGCARFGCRNSANDWDPWTEEGRRAAIATINRGMDLGVSYIDVALLHGDGHSEALVGEIMRPRRDECVLASKTWFEHGCQQTLDSVHASFARLQTERIDVLQVHGRMHAQADHDHVVGGSPLDALHKPKQGGKNGFFGIITEEPWTVLPFLRQGEFDVFQVAHNPIYQAAARRFLIEAAKANAGVVSMRTMTSGVLQHAARILAPEWTPPVDIADPPRLTFEVYKAEDAG